MNIVVAIQSINQSINQSIYFRQCGS